MTWFLIVYLATVKRSIKTVQVCVLMISTACMNVMLNCRIVSTCVHVKLDVLLVATVRFRFRKKRDKNFKTDRTINLWFKIVTHRIVSVETVTIASTTSSVRKGFIY